MDGIHGCRIHPKSDTLSINIIGNKIRICCKASTDKVCVSTGLGCALDACHLTKQSAAHEQNNYTGWEWAGILQLHMHRDM